MNIFSFLKQATTGGAPGYQRMTPAAFVAERPGDAVVLDVRTPVEYRAGHLKGARNIDVAAGDFQEHVAALDPNRPYYLYCRSGNRSGRAAVIMHRMGFERVYNVGGIDDLVRAGAAIER